MQTNHNEYLLGIDIGSSSVKVALVKVSTGELVSSSAYPTSEAPIISKKIGWAEQFPEDWWIYFKNALSAALKGSSINPAEIKAIGITYQMHGLVCVDKTKSVVRPAIIWCDSRAVKYGEKACNTIGKDYCFCNLLNSPANFTASKLAWVKENEPAAFKKIYKIMLPGDYLIMRLSGECQTTVSGLSEGIFWNFKDHSVDKRLMDYFGFDPTLLSDVVPTFGLQCVVSKQASAELGLVAGTPISYRAGDQPNNAMSLNVFNSGEIASTAGTSGVVYGVTDNYPTNNRNLVNVFAHVNYTESLNRLGVLLCINGTGILNAWMRRNILDQSVSYNDLNQMASKAPIGSNGVLVIPFGNGAERVLNNKEIGCSIHGLNLNHHNRTHLLRAAQEGIVYSFCYGMEVMKSMKMDISSIHAGKTNMFLSDLFVQTLSTLSGAEVKLYDTDGSIGAARGAGIGAGIYHSPEEAFSSLHCVGRVMPIEKDRKVLEEAYSAWKEILKNQLIRRK